MEKRLTSVGVCASPPEHPLPLNKKKSGHLPFLIPAVACKAYKSFGPLLYRLSVSRYHDFVFF